jgi:nucleoside-diphosphate-sugar epimerase
MRVFVTGATGFIGSAVVQELKDNGHEVVGLARSPEAAAALAEEGVTPHRGDLDDPDSLRTGAQAADGVIHTAYIHDFSQMEMAAQADRRAIETLGQALEGSDRPLVATFGTALIGPGRVVTEDDSAPDGAHPRAANEQLALSFADRGVRVSILRPPPSVHGRGDHGFVPMLIDIARSKGSAAYVGGGDNRWPAVHRLDAATLYRLALESAAAGTVAHAIGEEGVPTRSIAEAIGRHLDLPVLSLSEEEAAEHFGWMAMFFGRDVPASSALTRERLGWQPVQQGLIADLDEGHYFDKVAV